MINEGADWHMSGTDSLLYVESTAPWQSRTATELLLMQKNGPFLQNIYRAKPYETIGYIT